jgi:hypothetical protein
MTRTALTLFAIALTAIVEADVCDPGTLGTGNHLLLQPPAGAKLDFEKWHVQMLAWRTDCIKEIKYNGSIYDEPKLSWTQQNWISPQMHAYDQSFYNITTHSYSVQAYLDDVTKRYGGVDEILIWPTYTNIGIDDRNQFDLIRSMPGGVPAIKKMVQELHDAGVKALWPYNPWDFGTHRPGNVPRKAGNHTFVYRRGALQAGNDLQNGTHTMAEAKQICAQLPKCLGFTYHSDEQNVTGQPMVYFKSTIIVNKDDTWSTFVRDGGEDDAVAMAQLLADTGADGFNGDTMTWVLFTSSLSSSPSSTATHSPSSTAAHSPLTASLIGARKILHRSKGEGSYCGHRSGGGRGCRVAELGDDGLGILVLPPRATSR